MCYWNGEQPIAHHDLLRKDAIVAYKNLNAVEYGADAGVFKSPHKSLHWWHRLKMKQHNRYYGIFAFKYKTHAKEYFVGRYVVKVLLYGKVREYGASQYRSRCPGYIAEKAEIVEILHVKDCYERNYVLPKVLKRYPKLKQAA